MFKKKTFIFDELKFDHLDYVDKGHLSISGAKKVSLFGPFFETIARNVL